MFEHSNSAAVNSHHLSNEENCEKLKLKLLNRAFDGKARPGRFAANTEERLLASALNDFTAEDSESYDQKFNRQIKVARPDWFINEHDFNKKKLLEAAKMNLRDSEIVTFMGFYLVKTSRHFDSGLHDEIKALQPAWVKNLRQ